MLFIGKPIERSRLYDEENDIDGKIAQVDMSSLEST